MQRQSLTVAIIVVVTFGAGFGAGRASVSRLNSSDSLSAEPMRPATEGSPHVSMTSSPMPLSPETLPPSSPTEAVNGTLEEILQVPSFTYLRLKTTHGDQWAAIPTHNELKVGQQIVLAQPMKMTNFTSKTLNRTFAEIWFGGLGSAK